MVIQTDPYLDFKTDALRAEWAAGDLHPGLVALVRYAAWLHYRLTGRKAVITSLLRDDNPHSPHCARPCRGADLRTNDISDLTAREWEAQIKAGASYLGEKSSALFHDVGQGAHLHLQVSILEPDPRKET